jgi:quercetin dioxygenase-like cupin family protein
MELSERCIQTLENEGFTSVYEESLVSGETFAVLESENKVSIFVTEGSLAVEVSGETKPLLPGDRFDFPPQLPHEVVAGQAGCQIVVGELI